MVAEVAGQLGRVVLAEIFEVEEAHASARLAQGVVEAEIGRAQDAPARRKRGSSGQALALAFGEEPGQHGLLQREHRFGDEAPCLGPALEGGRAFADARQPPLDVAQVVGQATAGIGGLGK